MHVFVDAESKRWFSRSFDSFHIAMFDLPYPWTAVKLAAETNLFRVFAYSNLCRAISNLTCQVWSCQGHLSCSAVANFRAKIPLRHVAVCPHQEFHASKWIASKVSWHVFRCLQPLQWSSIFTEGHSRSSRSQIQENLPETFEKLGQMAQQRLRGHSFARPNLAAIWSGRGNVQMYSNVKYT